MDSINGGVKTNHVDKQGFLNVVFAFDEDAKAEMLNMVQYVVLALIPSILILKIVKNVAPEEDDTKGSLEILVEILLQLFFMVLAIYFTHKAIKYVPTYSGINYISGGDPTIYLLPFVILLLAMQTKIGAKSNILYERTLELWQGKTEEAFSTARAGQNKNNVTVSQPLAGQFNPSQADNIGTMNLLPNNTGMTTQIPNRAQNQKGGEFNAMYQGQPNSNQGAESLGQFEPVAANAIGGGFGAW